LAAYAQFAQYLGLSQTPDGICNLKYGRTCYLLVENIIFLHNIVDELAARLVYHQDFPLN
jgi:hypothetical protein